MGSGEGDRMSFSEKVADTRLRYGPDNTLPDELRRQLQAGAVGYFPYSQKLLAQPMLG